MESQNTEYKESWRDEYIKWIGGFANAQGGKLYLGINDKGIVTGIADAKKLLEDIPNKTKDILGILVDVHLKIKNKLHYIEIVTEPYPYPISYKGQYYYRSGSTKQELKGAALDKFILQKQGRRWDAVPLPNLAVRNLSAAAIADFKNKAANTQRISPEVLKEKTPQLLQKLHLKADAVYLKRAAALLFHPDPEKYITGAYVKIGFFNTDDDLAYQDEIHGPVFEQVEKTMDLLLTKYLQAAISYKGINRIETFPIPQAALREAVLNAVVHKDYSSNAPIQISVYNNKLMIWNAGQLPDNWTVARLSTKHPSQPNNPDVANCFFRAGLIEAWGRGTLKILQECKIAKAATPVFKNEEADFWVIFSYKNAIQNNPEKIPVAGTLAEKIIELIRVNNSITIISLAKQLEVAARTVERILKELQQQEKVERTGSKKSGEWILR